MAMPNLVFRIRVFKLKPDPTPLNKSGYGSDLSSGARTRKPACNKGLMEPCYNIINTASYPAEQTATESITFSILLSFYLFMVLILDGIAHT